MAPISLKIIMDDGAVTRTIKFDPATPVMAAISIIKEKINTGDDGNDYGLFLPVPDAAGADVAGCWLAAARTLDHYMLRDGDSLLYLRKYRSLRVRMLDGTVKTLLVDESKRVHELMAGVCARIGISNHEEYGLCLDVPEAEEGRPTTGTLTLKRAPRERDHSMDQLSKKLKTDDNVEWLEGTSTLREQGVAPNTTLLLKRRLFYSDRNVDARDPVQLNLLYVQTRDDILEGRHPVTEDLALVCAAIQCQVQFGDFQEDRHKPGFLENLKEFLPEQFSNSWGAEKRIWKLHSQHVGLAPLDAKHLYIKTAREMKTYGVTFFLVKEKMKNKKKLIPRLLGISSDSILRLDEVTKEILQEWKLTQVRSYNARNETFMLNFGDYSDKEYTVKTNEASRIRDILESYIDLIRKKMSAPGGIVAVEGGVVMQETVEMDRAQCIEHVSHGSAKAVEHSFVGPSQILPYEAGSPVSHGTQTMTVQQTIVMRRQGEQHQVLASEIAMRGVISLASVKKLKRMNANSVKIVNCLAEQNGDGISQAQRITQDMQQEMPDIIQGIQEAAAKQASEKSKRLLKDLDELIQCMRDMEAVADKEGRYEEMQQTAMTIANLTAHMCFDLDPRKKKEDQTTSEVVTRRSSCLEFIRKLKRLNSNSVLIANYLTDEGGVSKAKELILQMRGEMGDIVHGIKDSAANQSSENRKRLLQELDDLLLCLSKMEDASDKQNGREAMQEASLKIAELTTALCLELDPQNRRRSDAVRRSRASFILEEQAEKRAHGSAGASLWAVLALQDLHGQTSAGQPLSQSEVGNLQRSAADSLTALNVAVARYVKASDPATSEPAAAMTSLEDIKRLAAALATDGAALSGSDDVTSQNVRRHLDELLRALAALCGDDVDGPKAMDDFTNHSQKLAFILGRNAKKDPPSLVAARETLLSTLSTEAKPTQQVTPSAAEVESHQRSANESLAALNEAVARYVKTTDPASKEVALIDIRRLVETLDRDGAALSASDDSASPSVRPHLDGLRRALAALCADHGDTFEAMKDFEKQTQKLEFILGHKASKEPPTLIAARDTLLSTLATEAQPSKVVTQPSQSEMQNLQRSAADSLTALNEAVARYAQATNDQDHVDPNAAVTSLEDIKRLVEALDRDAAALSASNDENASNVKHHLSNLRRALAALCSDEEVPKEAMNDFAKQSQKLAFILGRARDQRDAPSLSAARDTLLSALAASEAQKSQSQITAPKSSEEIEKLTRSAADSLTALNDAVSRHAQATDDQAHLDPQAAVTSLKDIKRLVEALDRDGAALSASDDSASPSVRPHLDGLRRALAALCADHGVPKEALDDFTKHSQKLAFILGCARDKKKQEEELKAARKNVKFDLAEMKSHAPANKAVEEQLQQSPEDSLAKLNVAVAKYIQAAADSDHKAAVSSLEEIQRLATDVATSIAKDNAVNAADRDGRARAHLAALLRALEALAKDDTTSPEKLNTFAEQSRKLAFVLGPVGIHPRTITNHNEAVSQAVTDLLSYVQDNQALQASKDVLSAPAAEVARSAAALQSCVQVTSPIPHHEQSRAVIRTATERLADSVTDLVEAAQVALQDSMQNNKQDWKNALTTKVTRLAEALDHLTSDYYDQEASADVRTRSERLRFAAAAAGLENIPILQEKPENLKQVEASASQKIGKVNAAIADLLLAQDEFPNPTTTEEAVVTIVALTPQLASQIRAISAITKNSALEDDLNAWADALRRLLEDLDRYDDPQSTADELATASRKLLFALHSNGLRSTNQPITEECTQACITARKLADPSDSLAFAASQHSDQTPRLRYAAAAIAVAAATEEPAFHETLEAMTSRARQVESSARGLRDEETGCGVLEAKMHALRNSLHDHAQKLYGIISGIEEMDKELIDKQVSKKLEGERRKFAEAAANSLRQISESKHHLDTLPSTSLTLPALSRKRCEETKLAAEQRLAAVDAAAGHYLMAIDADPSDYARAAEHIKAFATRLTEFVRDGLELAQGSNQDARTLLVNRLQSVCHSATDVCASHGDIDERFKSMLEFSRESAQSMALLCRDLDPAQEKLIANRIREIAQSSPSECAATTTQLVYVSQLVSTSIQHEECKQTLLTSCDNLQEQLKSLEQTPSSGENVQNTEKLLQDFVDDVKQGRMVRKREVIVIENTPLRSLAMDILDDAKRRAGSTSDGSLRHQYALYHNKLTEAIHNLDIATYNYRKDTNDTAKRIALENAVNSLQVAALQTRPAAEAAGNVVDLMDFERELLSCAESSINTISALKVTSKQDKNIAHNIKQLCDWIESSSKQLLAPEQSTAGDDELGNIVDIDTFAQKCLARLKAVKADHEKMTDSEAKTTLETVLTDLAERSNLLSFATRAAISTAAGAALDGASSELAQLKKTLPALLPIEGRKTDSQAHIHARAHLAAAANGAPASVCPALRKYVTGLRRATGGSERDRACVHAQKVCDLLERHLMARVADTALWVAGGNNSGEVVKELYSFSVDEDSKSRKNHVVEEEIQKLLNWREMEVRPSGDKKQLEKTIEENTQILAAFNDSLTRDNGPHGPKGQSGPMTSEEVKELVKAVTELASHAVANGDMDDDDADTLAFVTYDLLRLAGNRGENVTPETQKRLLETCKLLNDALDKLSPSKKSPKKTEFKKYTQELSAATYALSVHEPSSDLAYNECVEAMNETAEVLESLKTTEKLSSSEVKQRVTSVHRAVTASAHHAAQCAYLLRARTPVPPAPARARRAAAALAAYCDGLMATEGMRQVKEELPTIVKQLHELYKLLEETTASETGSSKAAILECQRDLEIAGQELRRAVEEGQMEQVWSRTAALSDVLQRTRDVTAASPTGHEGADDVIMMSKEVMNQTQSLLQRMEDIDDDDDNLPWVVYSTGKKGVVDSFEKLLNGIRNQGATAGFIAKPADEEEPNRSYIQTQVHIANSWLERRSKKYTKKEGEEAVKNILEYAEKMLKDLDVQEREDTKQSIAHTEQLLAQCCARVDTEKASALMEKVHELSKAVERWVVYRVVELELGADSPSSSSEESAVQYAAAVARARTTARYVAAVTLRPMLLQQLVTAAEQLPAKEQDSDAQECESWRSLRAACVSAVDPAEYVQAAGETIQRLKNEWAQSNDHQTATQTSRIIIRLVKRVVATGSELEDKDVKAAVDSLVRDLPKDLDEPKDALPIIQKLEEVESALKGETIFKAKPESNEPIFNAAHGLHAATQAWSARDNDMVAAARQVAVGMARLASHMRSGNQPEVRSSSALIVYSARLVALLATRLAARCSDARLASALSGACGGVATLSAQLQMLTSVKTGGLVQLNSDEAMTTLIGNAQNLMRSVQDVLRAAASASVKIQAQRGGAALRWVRVRNAQ